MRIAIVYPPFSKDGKTAFLSQNRWFKYSSARGVALYPVVLATAATMLKNDGHAVLWLDGINEGLSFEEFDRKMAAFEPDLVVAETKAPVVKRHWDFFAHCKERLPKSSLVVVGDHVTLFPEESLVRSPVDFVLTGGDYDFLLRNLTRCLPDRMADLEPGIWYHENREVVCTGAFKLEHDLDGTPLIDRELTKWWLYKEADFYAPSARVMFGRGCGGIGGRPGFCTFCIWVHSFWKTGWRLRNPKHCVREVKDLVDNYGVREVFDDTDGGACFDKKWLEGFRREMEAQGLRGKVCISSNVRADVLQDPEVCKLMVEAGYRMVKPAVEAGTDETLRRIGKDATIDQIVRGIKTAKDHGLVIHLSAMVGYPWETEEDVQRTYELLKELLLYKTRAGDSLQASIVMPYPGTPLWRMAIKNEWLTIQEDEYEKLAMDGPAMETNGVDPCFWIKRMWALHHNPLFLIRSLLSVRRLEDIQLLARGLRSQIGHLGDY